MPENKRYRVISSKRGSLSHARGFPLSGLLGIHSYSGNRRSTFSYDVNGNVTSDATNSLQSSYNLFNLPSQIKSGSTVKANYTYLSDGTNSYAVDYHITDHLGSVRAIVNTSGTIQEQNDYYPFGTRHPNGLTQLSANRWRFSGKEEQDGFGIAYSDFGARFYDRSAAWTAMDPLAEKYYAVSPYVYCNNSPINRIDLFGMDDYRYDDKTGQFFLMKSTDDETDRVLGYHLNNETGKYEQNTKWYQVKKRLEGIQKGILKDGMNLFEDNHISTGKEGEPSLEGIQRFLTHLSRFSETDRLKPSSTGKDGGDMGFKERQLKNNPNMKFLIITNPDPFYY